MSREKHQIVTNVGGGGTACPSRDGSILLDDDVVIDMPGEYAPKAKKQRTDNLPPSGQASDAYRCDSSRIVSKIQQRKDPLTTPVKLLSPSTITPSMLLPSSSESRASSKISADVRQTSVSGIFQRGNRGESIKYTTKTVTKRGRECCDDAPIMIPLQPQDALCVSPCDKKPFVRERYDRHCGDIPDHFVKSREFMSETVTLIEKYLCDILSTTDDHNEVEIRLGSFRDSKSTISRQPQQRDAPCKTSTKYTDIATSAETMIPVPSAPRSKNVSGIDQSAHAMLVTWCASHSERIERSSTTIEILCQQQQLRGDVGDMQDGQKSTFEFVFPKPQRSKRIIVDRSRCTTTGVLGDEPIVENKNVPVVVRRVSSERADTGDIVVERIESKKRVCVVDIIGELTYPGGKRASADDPTIDIRIAENVETPIARVDGYYVSNERRRERTSFAFHKGDWIVDLTIVSEIMGKRDDRKPSGNTSGSATSVTLSDAISSSITYECELEITAVSGRSLRAKELAHDVAAFVVEMSCATASTWRPSSLASLSHRKRWIHQQYYGDIPAIPAPDIKLDMFIKVPDPSERDDSKKGRSGCFYKKQSRFPGAMPFNFHRSDLWTVWNTPGNYLFAEKTDGVRHLFVIDDSGTYLFDRSSRAMKLDVSFFSSFHTPKSSDSTIAPSATPIVKSTKKAMVTVLDSELVRDKKTMKPMLLVFDALMVDSVDLRSRPFSERLVEAMRITDEFGSKAVSFFKSQRALPLMMFGKQYSPIDDLRRFFVSSIDSPKSQSRTFSCERYACDTDGLIFADKHAAYVAGTNFGTLLKWKYPDSWTVDVRIERMEDDCMVVVGATASPSVSPDPRGVSPSPQLPPATIQLVVSIGRVKFEKEDYDRMSDDFAVLGSKMVAECAMDARTGKWKYISPRDDKGICNNSIVVTDTLAVQAEHVTHSELVYTLYSGKDNWDAVTTDLLDDFVMGRIVGK